MIKIILSVRVYVNSWVAAQIRGVYFGVICGIERVYHAYEKTSMASFPTPPLPELSLEFDSPKYPPRYHPLLIR